MSMQVALSVDALDQPVHEGDVLITDSGKAFFVVDTENSFIRHGFLRVYEAKRRRGSYYPDELHTYLKSMLSVRLDIESLPAEPVERRKLYNELRRNHAPSRPV